MERELEDLLVGYFSGDLEASGGLRSWLGPWQDHGPVRHRFDGAAAPEHALATLEAVRRERLVARALHLVGREHARVLRALYTPVPATFPHGLEKLGRARVAACVLVDVDHLRDVVEAAASKSTGPGRTSARRELAQVMARTNAATAHAEEAFEAALATARREAAEQRRARLRCALMSVR